MNASRSCPPRQREVCRWLLLAPLLVIGVVSPVFGQKLAPRAYWPAPEGTKVLSLGISYQHGDVLVDPSLPVVDLDARIVGLQGGYLEVFSLMGRTASLGLVVPFLDASFEGVVEGDPARRDVQGAGDVTITLGLNLLGAPSMTIEEFQTFRRNPRPILGLSIELQLPTGKYESEKYINLGGNRWAINPEIAYLYPMGHGYVLEMVAGGWFYGDNNDFVGTIRQQDPLFAMEFHLVRRQRGPFWTSLDATFYTGARTEVEGESQDDRQRNIRGGITIAFPLKRGHLLRFAGSTSLKTAAGGKYNSYLLAYAKAWR
jgi:hypothetical protein